MIYLLGVILLMLFFGKTGKVVRYLITKSLLFILAYLTIPLAILIIAFQ